MRTFAQPGRSIICATGLLAATALLACTSAHAAVVIEGTVECRDWTDGRATNTAVNLEHYVLGLLNGLALGRGREFWRSGGKKFSPQQAYQWMDSYCQANPIKQVMTGAQELFNERTEASSAARGKK